MTAMQFHLVSANDATKVPEFTLTCTSEGGPATTVIWTRDGEAVSGDSFTATRRLDDPVTAAYTLTLSVVGRQGGVYRCQVAKGGPGALGNPVSSSMELEVKGKIFSMPITENYDIYCLPFSYQSTHWPHCCARK